MTTMDDDLEDKWCTCLRRQTTNDAHFWDNKHQMNDDAHVWDDKRQMMHIFETTGFDTTKIAVNKCNSTITTKTLYQCDNQQLSQ